MPLEEKNHANSNGIRGVVFGDGTFVIHGNPGNSLLYSTNGRDYKMASQPKPGSTWFALAHGNHQFVAVNALMLARSSDGVTWESSRPAIEGSPWKAGHFRQMAFGNGVFVCVGDNGRLGVTKDGQTWLHHHTPYDKKQNTFQLLFGHGQFVWLRGDGVFSSTDGISWKPIASDLVKQWPHKAGTFTGKEFFISGNNQALRSTDGIQWTEYKIPKYLGLSGIYANNLWLRGHWQGKLSVSTDLGQTWKQVYQVEILPGREKIQGGVSHLAYGIPKE